MVPHRDAKFDSEIYVCGNGRLDPLMIEIHGDGLEKEEIDYVASGAYYTCIKTVNGNLWTVGKNDEAQLCHGIGETLDWDAAKMVVDPSIKGKVVAVACGYYHTMIVVQNGDVWMAGYNHVDTRHVKLTQLVNHETFGHCFIDVKSRGQHNILMTREKHIFVIGWNPYGQLGLGNTINLTYLKELCPAYFTGHDVREIVCGYYWTAFVLRDNNVYLCGDNKRYQCGLPEQKEYLLPTCMEDTNLKSNVDTVVCGHYYSLYLTRDKKLFISGCDIFDNGDEKSLHQVNVHPLIERTCIQEIFGGFSHAFIVTTDQEVYAAGQNRFFQCGINDPSYLKLTKLPRYLHTSGFIKISAGWEHSVFYTTRRTKLMSLMEKLYSLLREEKLTDVGVIAANTVWRSH
jgi:alpha-tubulin suppressor-like RCC1 family protein